MNIATGTITFLFTDIEGSTKLWEQYPDAMRIALTRHDLLVHEAIEANNGTVVKSTGDGVLAAFATAPDGLAAALALQQTILTESWPEQTPIRVRTAVHVGTAEYRDGDYYGSTLNRAARLMAAGHGGQVLLSQVTHELVQDCLPAGASLQNRGEHRLRDLGRPEHVYQLLHPDLPNDFPPLKSLNNPDLPNNLPQQVTSFIGRDKESAEIKALIARTRLLTLTGSGGTGKTRLSLQVASDLLDIYPDGVWFAELAPLTDAALVPQTVAEVLGIRETPGEPITKTLGAVLKDKQMLLILDNCEHVLDAAARLVDTVLRSCPHVKFLVSSRETLGIAGESTYRVPSLSLPDLRKPQTPERLSHYEAVRLFIERAVAAKADFAVTSQNAPALASVCYRLDGIPLAIELSASRIRSMTVEELEKRLDDRFRILTGGSRTALPRQQTLRATIDWSYDLLEENQKILLARLSVFSGGWTLEGAEQVCAGEGVEAWEVLDLMMALADKSLVIAEERGETSRYRLLEMVRQYAREKLAESGEAEGLRKKQRGFFLAMAEEAEQQLQGPEQIVWLDRLETEHDNLRAALEGENGEAGLRIAGALWRFWQIRGYLSEGRARLSEVLRETGKATENTAARAMALNGAGVLARRQGDFGAAGTLYQAGLALYRELGEKGGVAFSLIGLGDVAAVQGDSIAAQRLYEESLALSRELGDKRGIANSINHLGRETSGASARKLLEESLALYRELGDKQGIAQSLRFLALVVYSQQDYMPARTLFEESLAIQRELGDKGGIAQSLNDLGVVAYRQGDDASARMLWQESLPLFRELGSKGGIAYSLTGLGHLARDQGNFMTARTLFEECLAIRQELGIKQGIAYSLNDLGVVAKEQGDYVSARTLYEESLALRRESENKRGIADSLEGFADLAAAQGQAERAAQMWGASERLREETDSPLPPNDQEKYDHQVSAARQSLSEEAFSAAWARGRAMTMEQAIEYALEEPTQ